MGDHLFTPLHSTGLHRSPAMWYALTLQDQLCTLQASHDIGKAMPRFLLHSCTRINFLHFSLILMKRSFCNSPNETFVASVIRRWSHGCNRLRLRLVGNGPTEDLVLLPFTICPYAAEDTFRHLTIPPRMRPRASTRCLDRGHLAWRIPLLFSSILER